MKTGLFGGKESFVPLSGANLDDEGVHVNVAKDQVFEAPRSGPGDAQSRGDAPPNPVARPPVGWPRATG